MSRVFDRKPFSRAIKHTIEPYAIYRYQGGISDFSQIIRFDFRDILADTNEVEYGVVNRLFAKRRRNSARNAFCQHPEIIQAFGKPDRKRRSWRRHLSGQVGTGTPEIFSWTIANKYFANPYFGGALVPGNRNVFDTTVDFTGIAAASANLACSLPSACASSGHYAGLTDFQWDLD